MAALQELLAPELVVFYNADWQVVGHVCKGDNCARSLYAYGIHLNEVVSRITGIPQRYLQGDEPLRGASIAQRMSWASHRTTTRLEDEAYCLLGIFNVNMPMLYGEGRNAFRRLQLEIIQRSTDHSIFAWSQGQGFVPIFATLPAAFVNSSSVTCSRRSGRNPYVITNNGLQLQTKLYLPSKPFRPSTEGHEYEARLIRLACRDGSGARINIELVKGNDRYFRFIPPPSHTIPLGKLIDEKVIYLDTGVEDTAMPGQTGDEGASSESDLDVIVGTAGLKNTAPSSRGKRSQR